MSCQTIVLSGVKETFTKLLDAHTISADANNSVQNAISSTVASFVIMKIKIIFLKEILWIPYDANAANTFNHLLLNVRNVILNFVSFTAKSASSCVG